MGRKLTETTKLSDSQGNLTTQSVATNTYDGNGDQLGSTDSTIGGSPEKWVYDQFGNVTKHWATGTADNTVDARGTRDTYDSENDVVGESLPGNSNAPGSSGTSISAYDDNGYLTRQTNPDGSWRGYTYDGDGNETSVTQPTSGYSSNPNNVAVTSESCACSELQHLARRAEEDLVHVDVVRLADGEGDRARERVGGDRGCLVELVHALGDVHLGDGVGQLRRYRAR